MWKCFGESIAWATKMMLEVRWELQADRVRNTGREEVGEGFEHDVYTMVPIRECWSATGKGPIGTG